MNYNLLGRAVVIAGGILLDLIFGDPPYPFHPVRLTGALITSLEKILRKLFRIPFPADLNPFSDQFDAMERSYRKRSFIAGILLVILTISISVGIPFLIIWAASLFSSYLGILISVVFAWQMLAGRELWNEAMAVRKALPEGKKNEVERSGVNRYQAAELRLKEARKAVGLIVGRDTGRLNEEGVIRAAVETVAENTSDGVIAPLIYMALFGVCGAFFYKAVNTMDSMVGYTNERYMEFGKAAAKTDDLLNFIPSRISALLMLLGAVFLHIVDPVFDAVRGWRIFKRDRKKHASPNSAQTEAACAGILGVRLNGPASYSGVMYDKPWIGDATRRIVPHDISRALMLMAVSSGITAVVAEAVVMIIALKG